MNLRNNWTGLTVCTGLECQFTNQELAVNRCATLDNSANRTMLEDAKGLLMSRSVFEAYFTIGELLLTQSFMNETSSE